MTQGQLADQLPTTYLQLFQASAARYCPGLSWTVLAAIGQIESADGTNDGPVQRGRARADAVPAVHLGGLGHRRLRPDRPAGHHEPVRRGAVGGQDAVRGRGRGRAARRCPHAIFDYNHANWYVNEVLALAAEYAGRLPLSRGRPAARGRLACRPGWIVPWPPYDAFLLVSFGGPEGRDDVMPFLQNVTRGRGVPRRAAGAGGRALLPVRRGQPDQPAVPRPARRDREGLRGQRHRPAGVLGQPELGSAAGRHGGGDGRRRQCGTRSRS